MLGILVILVVWHRGFQGLTVRTWSLGVDSFLFRKARKQPQRFTSFETHLPIYPLFGTGEPVAILSSP